MRKTRHINEREIPHDPGLEAAVIGCIMQTNDVMDECKIIPTPEHFFVPANDEIFRVVRRMIGDNAPTDLVSVTNRFRENERLAQIGGAPYLTEVYLAGTQNAGQTYAYYVEQLDELMKRRLMMQLGKWATEAAQDTTADSSDLVAEVERRAFAIGETRVIESSTQLAMVELKQMIDVRRKGGEAFEGGLKTSIPPWDTILGGIMEERLYCITARPGEGKTAAIEQAMTNLLKGGYPVLVFERDMPRSKLLGRMACRLARESFYKFERGKLDAEALDAIEKNAADLEASPFYIYDPVRLTGEDVHAIVRREKRKNGIVAWFLDYAQLLDVGEDIRLGLTRASMEFKRTVNETKVPGIIVAQLNRKGADKSGMPNATQIKEFDQLHADAGVVMVLYNELSTEDRELLSPNQPIMVKWNIDKNNFGLTSIEPCMFNRTLMEFYKGDIVNV